MDDKHGIKRLSFSLDSYAFYIIPVPLNLIWKRGTFLRVIKKAIEDGEDLIPFKPTTGKAPLESEMMIREDDWNKIYLLVI